jgi:CheY-like chemotaxis protein
MLLTRSLAPVRRCQALAILLAEDTPGLQALITLWLEEAGHTVVATASGREIVELITERSFDLLITDILMPDGDGWDAIAQVHRLCPETRILAMSGGAREMPANTVLRAAHAAGAIGMLPKPFCRPEFFDAIARVMAG